MSETPAELQLLTVGDLMARLRCSRNTVYRLIWAKALRPVYLDDRPRFRAADVEAMLEERRR
jgi:predicted DNA-binding transcriptional regulator AlpA